MLAQPGGPMPGPLPALDRFCGAEPPPRPRQNGPRTVDRLQSLDSSRLDSWRRLRYCPTFKRAAGQPTEAERLGAESWDLGRLQVALAKASSLPETAWKACLLTGLNGWFSFPDFSRKDWQSCVRPGVRASAPRPGCWSVCPCPRPRSDAFAGRGGTPLLGGSLHVC